jgi:hypothetical protein
LERGFDGIALDDARYHQIAVACEGGALVGVWAIRCRH